MEQSVVLTKSQAEAIIVARLRSRFGLNEVLLSDAGGIERVFGWVFRIAERKADANFTATEAVPRMIIVNKYTGQLVASSLEYQPEEFVKRYEKLLARNQRDNSNWCGTAGFPTPWRWWRRKTVAEQAKEYGFYEIRAAEENV